MLAALDDYRPMHTTPMPAVDYLGGPYSEPPTPQPMVRGADAEKYVRYSVVVDSIAEAMHFVACYRGEFDAPTIMIEPRPAGRTGTEYQVSVAGTVAPPIAVVLP